MGKCRYEVYYKGKATGIFVDDRKISLKVLRKSVSNAQSYDTIEFKNLNQ